MSQPPLVSLIILCSHPHWLDQALACARAQSYPNCEIVVVDSSEKTFVREVVEPFLAQPGHAMRYYAYREAADKVYDFALRQSEGDYVKFLASADLLVPEAIALSVQALEQHPDCNVLISRRQRIDPTGAPLADILSNSPVVDEDSLIAGADLLAFQSTLHFNLLGELSASVIRRAALQPLQPDLFTLVDSPLFEVSALALYARLADASPFIWLQAPLCQIRVSDVWQQPGQREGIGEVRAERAVVHGWLRQRATGGKPHLHLVQVAALAQPTHWREQNLSMQHFANYNLSQRDRWLAQRTLAPYQHAWLQQQQREEISVAVIINTPEGSEAALQQTLASIQQSAQTGCCFVPLTLGCVTQSGVEHIETDVAQRIATLNAILPTREEAWFIFLQAGDRFLSSGVVALSNVLPQAESCYALYADGFFPLEGKPLGMAFRPDFNLDLILSAPRTMASHWLFRRELLAAAGGLDPAYPQAAEYDLILKLIATQGGSGIGHLAEPLLEAPLSTRNSEQDHQVLRNHLQQRGYPDAQISGDRYQNHCINYQHGQQPKVSLIILANWHLASLITCVTSLLEKTDYLHYEMLVVADNQASPERSQWLADLASIDPQRIRILYAEGEFQRSAMANLAAQQAQGEYLAFIHSELAMIEGDWLAQLLNHAQRPEVGIVGGKQLAAGNKIRHAGYILGVNGAATEAFRGQNDGEASFMGRHQQDQNLSAVSADFMLVRRELFASLGGFDTGIAQFDDVDFCLRSREAGYLTVWTPRSRAYRPAARHNPYASQSLLSAKQQKQEHDAVMYRRWAPQIIHDPAFNANLSVRSRQFEMSSDSALNWDPLNRPGLPKFMVSPGDRFGCGYYRMITPLEAMQEEGRGEGKLIDRLPTHVELARYQPDTLIVQRRYSESFQEWMGQVRAISQTYRVFELDDYLINLPLKNHHRKDFTADTNRLLRKTLRFFDRFVVSTSPLAEALADMHSNIRVVNNRLPVAWWGSLHSLRNQGRKPRIGWAGGSSHTGDLEMIADVVKAFAGEVEWVFLGMCPPKLRPYVHELHAAVDIRLYPQKLASLNLDLALAPVEDNLFNACKSNLRLMEYGACAIPVVCSDVACYQGDLPVTRVKNRFSDWRNAIRMHLDDSAASEKMGLALQQAIHQQWMLTGNNVVEWAQAWTSE
ncbi:glycosyltransferase [Pantoea sp. A4]|uniref:glycosyltransferase n=1 Tax=Pantoea sp. A4 TaxID=1225184 RepID=UPI00037FFE97|nr:glycosyltransferase [Pantoea sp. A4]